jgi:predicted metal-binding protein
MDKPAHHLFVCSSFRAKGEPLGVCHKKGNGLLAYIEGEILDRGMDAMVTSTGCMKRCDDGPIMVVYPEAQWYGASTPRWPSTRSSTPSRPAARPRST